jgi:hypothetical protein
MNKYKFSFVDTNLTLNREDNVRVFFIENFITFGENFSTF